MNFAMTAVVLAVIWAAITGNFAALNLALGALIAVVALWIVRERTARPKHLIRARRIISLTFLFFYELALSAVRVAWLVVQPNIKSKLRPGIIAYPLRAKSDPEITLLANLITLTPGTLSVDVSEDRKFIFVHALSVPDKKELIESIATGFEAKIIEVFE